MDKLPNRPVFDQLHPNIYGPRLALSPGLPCGVGSVRPPKRHRTSAGDGQRAAPDRRLAALGTFAGLERHLMPDQRHPTNQRHPTKISFRDWRIGDFAVWGSKLHSTHAAADMLLSLAAVALGLTAIGIVFVICANGVALGCNQPEPRGVTQVFEPGCPGPVLAACGGLSQGGCDRKATRGRFLAQDVESP
jgi:hypothetical protein